MAQFEIGNKIWKRRATSGRKPIFATPEDLWSSVVEYFEWNNSNPIMETKAFHFQGTVVMDEVPRIRAMTLQAMCFYIGISRQGWKEYCDKPAFSDITSEIQDVIFSQKFEGAAADQLNASIIARELGLADKQDINSSVSITKGLDDFYSDITETKP